MTDRAAVTELKRPNWRPGTFRALRHRNYRLYFSGQIVSLIGSWMQTTVLTWLAYELTEEARWSAIILAAHVLPTLILGVPGGTLADHLPRRPLIFLTQLGLLLLSLVLAGLIGYDAATPLALLIVSLLIGAVNAIDTPARLAFVIDMVGREDLTNAVALNSLIFNTARMAGPAVAGLLMPHVGKAGCILVNTGTFVAVLAALVLMRLPPRAVREARVGLDGSLLGGFTLLVRRPPLLLLTTMAAALAFFGWPLLSLLPALSDRVLRAGEAGFSWLTAGVGGGALLGALVVASFARQWRRTLLVLGVAVGVAALVGLARTTSLPVAVAWCAASGGGLILFFATGQATMQLGADEHNRGRVMGVWLTVLAGAQPAGNLVFGYLADAWSVRSVLLIAAAGITAVAVVLSVLALTSGSDAGRS
jgi:MFS family permease